MAVLARNYGEAGAIDHFRPDLGPAYSGHNAYWSWGPPPENTASTIVVGYSEPELRAWFGDVTQAARIDNGVGLANEEQDTPVWVARQRLVSWFELWPQLRRLG